MRDARRTVRKMAKRFWRGLREWCGDAAYERYLHSSVVEQGKTQRLSTREFYVEQVNRRYSRPNRCC